MSIKAKDSLFIEKYKEDCYNAIQKIDSSIGYDEFEIAMDELLHKKLKNPGVILDNNYTGETKDTSLLSVFDWVEKRKPIIAGNGTFYLSQDDEGGYNPIAQMLDGFLTERKRLKKRMFSIEDITSRSYQMLDLRQGNEKRLANSYYGGSGAKSSAFYSKWSAPATTLTAQSVISTTENTFEAFLMDNYHFLDLNELLHWANLIVDSDIEIDDWVVKPSKVELSDRLYKSMIDRKDVDYELITNYVENLSENQRTFLFYKNNLLTFIDRHDNIKSIFVDIFESIENLEYVDKNDPYWIDKIPKKYKDQFKGKTQKDWNKFVNKSYFMDPNDVPDTIKKQMSDLKDIIIQYCYVSYLPFDRIYRLRNLKRKTVTVIDTDSNILSLDTIIDYLRDNIMESDYGRHELNNIFILVNTITYIITSVAFDILQLYAKKSNVPEKYRPRLNMKNEFFFTKLIIGKTKKRYLSKVVLREGNLIDPPKYDIKGFDFVKATTSDEASKVFIGIIKKYILGPEIPDLKSTIRELMKFQKTIKNSIKNRELTYLTIGNAKDLAAYKDPASEQSVRGVLAWNYLYPENKIEFPSKVSLLKLNIFTLEDAEPLRIRYPEIYDIIYDKIFHDTTGIFVTTKKSPTKSDPYRNIIKYRGVQVLAIPSNAEIPEWCDSFIDYTTMINSIVSPFKSVMELFGTAYAQEGKIINGVNRKTMGVTNIIKF